MRRIVIPLVALALVLAGAVLGAAVFRGEVAGAAQPAQPPPDRNVIVANDASQAVPVREQGTVAVTSTDDPGRSAFAFFESDSWESNEDSHTVTFTVPEGKRLVIQSVSIQSAFDTIGQKSVAAGVQARVNGEFEDYIMAPVFTGRLTSVRDVYIVSQPTTIYADGGTDVDLFGVRDGFTGGGIFNASVQGYLIDCTVAPCG